MTPDALVALSSRVAAHVGREGDVETITHATRHVETVAAFVQAYTRGNGFDVLGDPAPDVAAVIVAASARLTTNPEQVYQYTAADYSERPARFEGWTIAEKGVLHEHRRRWT